MTSHLYQLYHIIIAIELLTSFNHTISTYDININYFCEFIC